MEKIFYDEAALLLNVSFDTLTHGVSRGELTRAGLQNGKRLLIKDQVLLFDGLNAHTGHKKRISRTALSSDELKLWNTYHESVTNPDASVSEHEIPYNQIHVWIKEAVHIEVEQMREQITYAVHAELARVELEELDKQLQDLEYKDELRKEKKELLKKSLSL